MTRGPRTLKSLRCTNRQLVQQGFATHGSREESVGAERLNAKSAWLSFGEHPNRSKTEVLKITNIQAFRKQIVPRYLLKPSRRPPDSAMREWVQTTRHPKNEGWLVLLVRGLQEFG